MKQAHPPAATPRASTGDLPDGEVIERSRHEPELFALLFQRHAAAIARYAARRLGPAEDIVAGTFLAAFRQRSGYDSSRPDARPWLYGIASNLIRRHHRDEARELRALERTGHDLSGDAEDLAAGRWPASRLPAARKARHRAAPPRGQAGSCSGRPTSSPDPRRLAWPSRLGYSSESWTAAGRPSRPRSAGRTG